MATGLEVPTQRWNNLQALLVFLTVLTILIGTGLDICQAQDAQYWTNQYGNRARLLGGATIGSSHDVSAVFYNPGRLALLESVELVVAGTAFRFGSITLEDAFGNGLDLTSSRVGGAPSLFAGEFRFDWLGDTRLAYSFFTRYDFSLRFEIFADLTSVAELPDTDLLDAAIHLTENMTEYWFGLSWALPLGEKVGFGISGFGLVRDQRSRNQTLVQARTGGAGAMALQGQNFDYQYWGVLAKIGIGANLDDWALGMTVTTPNLRVTGSGNLGFTESLVDNGIGGDSSTHIISSYQKDLQADYNSPTSVGAGAAYAFPHTTIHGAAEWFQAVNPYSVLQSNPIDYPDSNATFSVDIADQRTSVINFGIGLEHDFKPRLSGYASFRTDYNAGVPDDKETRAPLSIWNIYHVAVGASFALAGSEFTLGAVYAWGDAKTQHGIDLVPDDDDDDEPVDLPQELDAHYRELTFVLGFSIGM